jgi:acyl-CoA reductase-like NAD-dependent aldehyde dehydrogenase
MTIHNSVADAPLAPETRAFLDGRLGHVINGHTVVSSGGGSMPLVDPSNGEEFGTIVKGTAEDVEIAVSTAREAFEDGRWRKRPALEKEAVLRRYGALIEQNARLFSDLNTIDGGVITSYSKFLVPFAVNGINYYAGWPTKLHGAVPPVSEEYITTQVREPAGVVGVIVPWNGPSAVASSFAAALACGNSIVLKPSEHAPLSAIAAARLALEAGVPPGVVNVVQGLGSVVGQALVEHSEVDAIAFTGSSQTGQSIQRAAAATSKKVGMELGGKSPNIVFADARLDEAAERCAGSVWGHAGQVCTAGTRVLVQRKIHDEFVAKMIGFSKDIRIGGAFDPQTQMGPVISAGQLERISRLVGVGQAEGAELALGGQRHGDRGYYHEPTIFVGVDNSMTIAREEIFGPVMSVISFEDEEEAVLIANSTEYGLAAGVWTSDLDRAHRMSQRLKAGTVWINCYQVVNPAVSYGGMKQSGFGRKLGAQSLDLVTTTKSVWIKLAQAEQS